MRPLAEAIKDHEAQSEVSEAMVTLAAIHLVLHCLAISIAGDYPPRNFANGSERQVRGQPPPAARGPKRS